MLALPAFTGAPEVNRVYNCDNLVMLRAMPSKSVDVVVTSPPYNQLAQKENTTRSSAGMYYKSGHFVKVVGGYDTYNDHMPEDRYQAWVREVVRECLRVSRGLVWVNHKIRYRDGVGIHPLQFLPFPIYSEVIWDRGSGVAFNSKRFVPSHEHIYGFGKPHYWNDEVNTKFSVWRIAPKGSDDHPCPYPEELVRRLILGSCPPGGVVFDPFMGEGTTAIVAQRLGCSYLGCDTSIKYVEIARRNLAMPYTPNMFETLEVTA